MSDETKAADPFNLDDLLAGDATPVAEPMATGVADPAVATMDPIATIKMVLAAYGVPEAMVDAGVSIFTAAYDRLMAVRDAQTDSATATEIAALVSAARDAREMGAEDLVDACLTRARALILDPPEPSGG